MTDKIEVPTCLSGGITKAGISHCMDSATHIIDTPTGAFRLKASNDEAKKRLKEYEDTKVIVTTCGYLIWGAECPHLSVYSVDLATDFSKKMQSF